MEFLNVLLGPLLKIIDKAVPDKTEANKIQGEITKVLIDQQSEIMQTMKDITLKELDGTPFQRNWRPTLSWMVISMWPYNYVVRPMIIQAIGVDLAEIPTDALNSITMMWTSVYSLGRSFEKSGSSIMIGTQK